MRWQNMIDLLVTYSPAVKELNWLKIGGLIVKLSFKCQRQTDLILELLLSVGSCDTWGHGGRDI